MDQKGEHLPGRTWISIWVDSILKANERYSANYPGHFLDSLEVWKIIQTTLPAEVKADVKETYTEVKAELEKINKTRIGYTIYRNTQLLQIRDKTTRQSGMAEIR